MLVGDVVDEDDAVCAFVVGVGDGFEALLPGGVPDLGEEEMRAVPGA